MKLLVFLTYTIFRFRVEGQCCFKHFRVFLQARFVSFKCTHLMMVYFNTYQKNLRTISRQSYFLVNKFDSFFNLRLITLATKLKTNLNIKCQQLRKNIFKKVQFILIELDINKSLAVLFARLNCKRLTSHTLFRMLTFRTSCRTIGSQARKQHNCFFRRIHVFRGEITKEATEKNTSTIVICYYHNLSK